MLVVWLPATSLCLVETAGFLSSDGCCPSGETNSTPANESTADSTCCVLAWGNYKANEDDRPIISSPLFTYFLIANLPELTERDATPQWNSVTSSPPELVKGWQFSFRTALLPRAPSFVS
jgi:hypothetical protein